MPQVHPKVPDWILHPTTIRVPLIAEELKSHLDENEKLGLARVEASPLSKILRAQRV